MLAASYEAKAFGVRTAMGGRQAQQLCPQVVAVRPRMDAYLDASRAVFEVFADTTPLVEALSVDEAFLDVAGLRDIRGSPVEIAVRLRAEVARRVGLPITVGVARTKFLAKVASRIAKPDGLLVVPPESELTFLRPLPVDRLWGVGEVTAAKLRERGVGTVGEVADLEQSTLTAMLGQASGRHLYALAHNRDPRPVVVGRRRGSIGSQRALGRRRRTAAELDAAVITLVDRVCRRARTAGRAGRTITVRLRFDDFTRATRSHTLRFPTAQTDLVLTVVQRLLDAAGPRIERDGLTLVGGSIGQLESERPVQLELPLRTWRQSELDQAVDAVRRRFGGTAVQRAAVLGHDAGLTVPLLAD